jgi:hypothetical protein
MKTKIGALFVVLLIILIKLGQGKIALIAILIFYVYYGIKIIKNRRENNAKIAEVRRKLEGLPFNARQILKEMLSFAESNINQYKEYDDNRKKIKSNLLSNWHLIVGDAQDKLIIEMEHIVKTEWNPRLIFLKERANTFDTELLNIFSVFIKLDKTMQKLTIWGINKVNTNYLRPFNGGQKRLLKMVYDADTIISNLKLVIK